MQLIKKIKFFTFLSLAIGFSTYAMEPVPKKKNKEKRSRVQRIRSFVTTAETTAGEWVNTVGKVMLGIRSTQELKLESFPFTQLPKDIQKIILSLLTTGATAESLKVAAYTINSLAQVNKELNTLLNDPDFCLKIIKNFATRFNCSDFAACAALETQQAQHQLNRTFS